MHVFHISSIIIAINNKETYFFLWKNVTLINEFVLPFQVTINFVYVGAYIIYLIQICDN